MRSLRLWPILLGTLALAGLPAPAGAQAVGSEFQVNTATLGIQKNNRGSVAGDASGDFVVVWWGGQGSWPIFGPRFVAGGERQGAEFLISSYTNSFQTTASVASDASGNFVVVSQSDPQDGDEYGIFGQRFDNEGQRLGNEFQVNTYTTESQEKARVASNAS